MRLSLQHCVALLFVLSTHLNVIAQNDRFAYAITDLTKEGSDWKVLRKLDLKSGEYSAVMLNGMSDQSIVFDASSKKQITRNAASGYAPLPFSTGVAALALDKKHNRLFFSPMFINQLRYIDLSSMKTFFVTDQNFGTDQKVKDGGQTISRMVIAPDGTGYAISNDATTFIQFSTGKKPVIKQLGSLIDDPANNNISVHNSCSSYGGDIISDEKGSIYMITARNHVFKINPQTKIATHQGIIKGLPASFTSNAAVVLNDGQLLVSSALDAQSTYVVNAKTWQAVSPFQTNIVYHTSDLANSNYLSSTGKKRVTQIETIANLKPNFSDNIQLYPNPVYDNAPFNIQFNNVAMGDYFIHLLDVNGRTILSKKISVGAGKATQLIPVSTLYAKGLYMVRVVNQNKNTMFQQKLVVQ